MFAFGIYRRGLAPPGEIGVFDVPVWNIACLRHNNQSIPTFFYSNRAYLEGHANNAHCLAAAVNTVLCALFALAGRRDTEERLKEFLAVRYL